VRLHTSLYYKVWDIMEKIVLNLKEATRYFRINENLMSKLPKTKLFMI